MRVRTWDWAKQLYAIGEVPDLLIYWFVDFLMNTRQWREDEDRLYQRVQKFDAQIGEYRSLPEAEQKDARQLCDDAYERLEDQTPPTWEEVMSKVRAKAAVRRKRQDSAARARAAKEAKQETVEA